MRPVSARIACPSRVATAITWSNAAVILLLSPLSNAFWSSCACSPREPCCFLNLYGPCPEKRSLDQLVGASEQRLRHGWPGVLAVFRSMTSSNVAAR